MSLRPVSRLSLAAVALCAAAASLASPLGAQSGQRTVVVGQLVDAETHVPIPGATVHVVNSDVKAVSGPDGQFRLQVSPGTHTVTLYRMGFQTALETWDVAEGSLDVGMIELAPDAIALAAIEVRVDRLERMRRASPMHSRTFDEQMLARSTYPNAMEFVVSAYNLMRVPCTIVPTQSITGGNCVRVRGGPRRPCLVIDEATAVGGFDALLTYRPQDIARIHVFAGGSFMQVYTTAFMARASERDWTPMPVEAQMRALCGFS